MTAIEFNLKYEDFLEDRFYGLDIDIPEVTKFLDEIFEDLIRMQGFSFAQIKLKFGTARFYADVSTTLMLLIEQKIDDIIKNKR